MKGVDKGNVEGVKQLKERYKDHGFDSDFNDGRIIGEEVHDMCSEEVESDPHTYHIADDES